MPLRWPADSRVAEKDGENGRIGYGIGDYRKNRRRAATNAGSKNQNARTLPNLYRVRILWSAALFRAV